MRKSSEKFVMFKLGANTVALRAEDVRYRIDWQLPITTIENTPPYVLGRTILCAEKEVVVQDLERRFFPCACLPTRTLTLLVCLPDQSLAGFMVDYDWVSVIEIEKPMRYGPLPGNNPLDSFVESMVVWRDKLLGDSNKCLWLLDPQKLAHIN